MLNSAIYRNIKPIYLDGFYISALLILNPAFVFIAYTPRNFYPDTFAYLAMANDLLQNGLLYVPSWGHVDAAVILPPVYPLLIALGSIFTDNLLIFAELLSSFSGIASTIIFYFILREVLGRFFSVLTLLIIQLNYYYFNISLTPLTEASFLLALSISYFIALKVVSGTSDARNNYAFYLGVACGFTFLTRQIGISLLFFMLAFILLTSRPIFNRTVIRRSLIILAGWAIIFIPYSASLYFQTGTHPFQQHIKMGQYTISSTDSTVQEEIKLIEDLPVTSYRDIYAKRRLMLKLLPDSSEMYSSLVTKSDKNISVTELFFENFRNPISYYKKVLTNFKHLSDVTGEIMMFLFLISCLSPLVLKYSSDTDLNRLLLPSFILFYLLFISGFTDKIPRYVVPIFPFCIIHAVSEFYLMANKRCNKIVLSLFFILFTGIALVSMPQSYRELPVSRKLYEFQTDYSQIRDNVNGEAMFSFVPYNSYMLGGKFRSMPNDSLDKVAEYGRKTGVKWILVNRDSSTLQDLIYYVNLDWYLNPALHDPESRHIKYCCETKDGLVSVFEIL